MNTCTFFGHRDAPGTISKALRDAVIELIRQNGVVRFLVGNEGSFDRIVQLELHRLQAEFPEISFFVVLSSLPSGRSRPGLDPRFESIYPEEVARTIPRFRIDRRNRWMIQQSDVVITYFRKIASNTQKYQDLALRQNKTVIAL
ncbi:MAG: hypothetical protein J6J21_06480 [Clostridia bacterium]|nr:hypothetical protein [Clostridia bacterium]